MTDKPIDFTAIKVGDHVLIRAEVVLTNLKRNDDPGVVASFDGFTVDVPITQIVGHEPAPPIVRPTEVGQRVRGAYNVSFDGFTSVGVIKAIDGDAALIRFEDDNRPTVQLLERLEVVE
jgi:hypothetical protein